MTPTATHGRCSKCQHDPRTPPDRAVAAFALIASGPESGSGPGSGQTIAGIVIALVLWPTGFIHALWVNFAVRLPLQAKNGA